MTDILAPCPGRVFPLAEVSDPVFAAEMVGPGVAIEPDPGETVVIAPIAGRIMKIHPHAFALASSDGVAVLVHLGINTVRLRGAGFDVLAEEESTVAAGDPMVRWDPSQITGDDISTTVMVVALDRPAGSVTSPALGSPVIAGDLLFSVDA